MNTETESRWLIFENKAAMVKLSFANNVTKLDSFLGDCPIFIDEKYKNFNLLNHWTNLIINK